MSIPPGPQGNVPGNQPWQNDPQQPVPGPIGAPDAPPMPAANQLGAPGASPIPPKPSAGGLAIGALVRGILAFVTVWAPIWGILSGGGAAVLGFLALRARQSTGMSITGIVLGGLALLTSVVTTLTTMATLMSPASGPTPVALPTEPITEPADPAAETFTMPDLVGDNLQDAQNELQALGATELEQADATGQDRSQIVDSNWKVCSQDPAAGETVPVDRTVVLSSVKNDEDCSGQDPEMPGIGDAVRVGDLELTVKSVDRATKLSNGFSSKKGNWLVVKVKLTNKGKEQVMVNSSDFNVKESDGTTYSTDSDGMTYVDSDEWLFLKDINPKTSATGTIVFAVPKSVKDPTLEVTSGFLGSDSTEISLSKP